MLVTWVAPFHVTEDSQAELILPPIGQVKSNFFIHPESLHLAIKDIASSPRSMNHSNVVGVYTDPVPHAVTALTSGACLPGVQQSSGELLPSNRFTSNA